MQIIADMRVLQDAQTRNNDRQLVNRCLLDLHRLRDRQNKRLREQKRQGVQ